MRTGGENEEEKEEEEEEEEEEGEKQGGAGGGGRVMSFWYACTYSSLTTGVSKIICWGN